MKTTEHIEILVIEDNPTERAAMERLLTQAGYNVKVTDSIEKALDFVDQGIDGIVAGVIAGDISGLDLMAHWRTYFPETPLPLVRETQSVDKLV